MCGVTATGFGFAVGADDDFALCSVGDLGLAVMYDDTIARKRSVIEELSGQLRVLTDGCNAAENAISELRSFQAFEKLDREIVYLLIDKILIHDENDIEIVWNGEFSQQLATDA